MEHNILYVNASEYNNVCKVLKWARKHDNFHKLLKLCKNGMIQSKNISETVVDKHSLLLFSSYHLRYSEIFLRSSIVLNSFNTHFNDILIPHEWIYNDLLQPFTNRIHTSVSNISCQRGYICNLCGLPNSKNVDAHQTMKKILDINYLYTSKNVSKKRMLIVIRKKTRRMYINALHDCDLYYECNIISSLNKSVSQKLIPETDIFVGVHGADFANAYAMRPHTRILEIMPPRGYWECSCNMHESYFKKYHNYTAIWSKYRVRTGRSYQMDVVINFYDIHTAVVQNKDFFESDTLHSLERKSFDHLARIPPTFLKK
jgi:hypothetical protein